MYVLACGDGSLYTGYATDVQARLAAHQSGRGAKYTKSHAPVSLVSQARFYSKARAMSAEAHFKRLSREQKDKLLERSKLEPLEDVLRRELPGFGEDTAAEFVCRNLASHVDPNYAAFMRPLVPTVDPRRLVGVRTPQLRKIARELYRRDDASDFMRSLPHVLFEENQVHALAIGMEREYERAIELYDLFLPHIDNWATCDQLPVRVLAEQPDRTLAFARRNCERLLVSCIDATMHRILCVPFRMPCLRRTRSTRFPLVWNGSTSGRLSCMTCFCRI